MSPSVAAGRFLGGLAVGAVLGCIYGFLRPLRQNRKNLADLLFLPALLYGTIYYAFAVCQGAPEPGYLPAPILGMLLWEGTFGRLFRPVWTFFWKGPQRLHFALGKFFQKICNFMKKIFASEKKSSTIK